MIRYLTRFKEDYKKTYMRFERKKMCTLYLDQCGLSYRKDIRKKQREKWPVGVETGLHVSTPYGSDWSPCACKKCRSTIVDGNLVGMFNLYKFVDHIDNLATNPGPHVRYVSF